MAGLQLKDAAGYTQQLARIDNGDGTFTPQHAPQVAGAPVAAANPMPVADATAAAALGTPADAAWGGAGNSSVVGALKALWAAVTGNLKVVLQAGNAVIGKVGLQVSGTDVSATNAVPVGGGSAVGSPPANAPVSVAGTDPSGNKQHLRQDAAGNLLVAQRNGLSLTQTTVPLAANTDTVLVAANPNRRYLGLAVIGTGQANLAFDTAASATAGWPLAAAASLGSQGGAMTWEGAGVPINALHGFSAAGTTIVVLEG